MNIDRFKKDHVTIMASVTEMRGLVKSGVPNNAERIVKALVAMSSTIKLHLAAEDGMLYPALARSKDASVSQMGSRFSNEMGAIATAYTEFARRWNLPSRLVADPAAFTSEANEVLKALHQRIQREDAQLYPAAEKA